MLGRHPSNPLFGLRIFDIDNPEVLKDPGNLSIRPVGIDTLLFASGTIQLDLRTDQEFTEFEFILNEGIPKPKIPIVFKFITTEKMFISIVPVDTAPVSNWEQLRW